MIQKDAFLWFVVLLFGISLFLFTSVSVFLQITQFPPPPLFFWQPFVPAEHMESALVKRVIDGDTIELEDGERVRYIGVNAPESVDLRKGIECFGKEAAEFNRTLVEGKRVRLERDISDRDRYGRLLRFVYVEEGTLVNEKLVHEGYAHVATYPPDVAKKDIFIVAEQEARAKERGLWGEGICN